MSSTTCSKCFAASEKCKTTKEHLKMSKTEVKKMEKTLVETEKELVQSRRKIAELRDQRKARANIQEEMAELKRQMAELMKEKEQEEAVHQKLTEEVAKAKESQPMSAAERREMIFDIKDKIGMSEGVHIAAIEQIFRLKHTTECWKVKKMVEAEELFFKQKHFDYCVALKSNLLLIQGNPTISKSEVPPLPEFPELTQKFKEEYKKAEERKNMELEQECTICQDVVDEDSGVFRCPVCKNSSHSQCIDQWFRVSQTCPCCRAKWN